MQDRKRRDGARPWLPHRAAALMTTMLLLLGALAETAQAMPVTWRSANFKYVVDGKPVRDVLRDFGASQGMVVAVAPDVDGTVAGKFDLTPRQFIELMARSYGFVYYFNGAVLHVSASQGMRSTLVRLNFARIQQLRETLERMNVAEQRFPIVYDESANTALVAGPQEYVDVIREIAVQLEKRTQAGGRSVTRVFPLRFAWAGDRRAGESDTVPGLATTLQTLYGHGDDKGRAPRASLLRADRALSTTVAPSVGAAQPEKSMDTTTLSLRRALNLDTGKNTGATSFAPTVLPPPTEDADGPAADNEALPVILADVAGNSILVRDLPERMPAYQALIASLDVQPRMVEIAVQILDVSENALTEVGVDWTLRGSHLDARQGADEVGDDLPAGGAGTEGASGVDAATGRRLVEGGAHLADDEGEGAEIEGPGQAATDCRRHQCSGAAPLPAEAAADSVVVQRRPAQAFVGGLLVVGQGDAVIQPAKVEVGNGSAQGGLGEIGVGCVEIQRAVRAVGTGRGQQIQREGAPFGGLRYRRARHRRHRFLNRHAGVPDLHRAGPCDVMGSKCHHGVALHAKGPPFFRSRPRHGRRTCEAAAGAAKRGVRQRVTAMPQVGGISASTSAWRIASCDCSSSRTTQSEVSKRKASRPGE